MKKLLCFIIPAVFFFSCNDAVKENVVSDNKQNTISKTEIPEGDNRTEITFDVAPVIIAPSLLKTNPAGKVFERRVDHKISFMPKEHDSLEVVSCYDNAFIETVAECFDNHRPLVLSPDEIWLLICQGVSLHVNTQHDSLKHIIFKEEKPKTLIVRNDSLGKGAEHWEKLINDLCNDTRKYTREDIYSWYVNDFSTTTAIDKTASQLTLLETYKKTFRYVGMSGCGIPRVTLKGKKADWVKIKTRIEKLNALGLSFWVKELNPILDEFISVYDGKVNKEFWQSIYKSSQVYMMVFISGWIVKFFPYTKDVTWNDSFELPETYRPNPYLKGSSYLQSSLTTADFPSGLAEVDIEWDNRFTGKKTNMLGYSGFFAIKQYADKSLEPFVSWAICKKSSRYSFYPFKRNSPLKLKHDHQYWAPSICDRPKHSAVYDVSQYKTQKEGLSFIRSKLETEVKNKFSSNSNLRNIHVSFLIYTNGGIGKIHTNKTKNKELTLFIEKQLEALPGKWMPALSFPSHEMDMFVEEADSNKLIPVNSKVYLNLFSQ